MQMYVHCKQTHVLYTDSVAACQRPEVPVKAEWRAVWSCPALPGLSESLRGEQTDRKQTEGSNKHNV